MRGKKRFSFRETGPLYLVIVVSETSYSSTGTSSILTYCFFYITSFYTIS
uniref:ORF49a n=1 Tax=Pinus thunbergii TaxID=3350 RepID=Q32951_PINTH|nr:ORF49a [Pinus thunbergii]